MSQPNGTPGFDASGLRERLPQRPEAPQKAESVETAQDAVKQLNEQEPKQNKDDKEKKTFGRTPDGTGMYQRAAPCLSYFTESIQRHGAHATAIASPSILSQKQPRVPAQTQLLPDATPPRSSNSQSAHPQSMLMLIFCPV